MNLYEELIKNGKSDIYPFHMPGHKRRKMDFPNPYDIDITEIDGFDNLHQAEGILLDAEKRANRMYGAEETFFLVNGSTCGILAAIASVARRSDKIAIAALGPTPDTVIRSLKDVSSSLVLNPKSSTPSSRVCK